MRVGVIGVGSIGQNHARVLSGKGVLSAVADVDVDRAKSTGDRYSVNSYSDYQEMISGNVDAVVIATPVSTHAAIARHAIDKGKHVLIEKPMTGNSRILQDLSNLAEKNAVILAAGLIERHNPIVAYAKGNLEAGEYGELVTASTRRVSSKSTWVHDIGVIMDLGIHDIDVLRFIVGSSVESVFALGGGKHVNQEDYANILLDFNNRKTGIVEVNWLTPMKVRRLSLTCSKNYVDIDYMDQSALICSSSFTDPASQNLYDVPLEFYTRKVSLKKDEPLKHELEDFITASEKGREPLVTGASAVEVLRIAEAALESLTTCRKVTIE